MTLAALLLARPLASEAQSWTSMGPFGVDGGVRVIAVDPTSSSTLYVGGEAGLFKSTDGGSSWRASSLGITDLRFQALAVDPRSPPTVYAGTPSGIFRSTDGGANWFALNEGLPPDVGVGAFAAAPPLIPTPCTRGSSALCVSSRQRTAELPGAPSMRV